MTPVEGVVERYNPAAKLFRIRYASQRVGDDAEDLDLMTLQDVLIMGKQYGDARADWGKTRDERTRAATFLAIFEEALEKRRYSKVHDSDRCENKEGDQGKCYNASTPGEKVLYDDEPRNMKEFQLTQREQRYRKLGMMKFNSSLNNRFE